ncbi:MAG: DUF721 domain-containing protein [Bacteroidales bacterium]|nr:DUF721 domain-containing protein [Bacteroidales bacterium]
MRRTNTEPLKDVINRFLKIYGGERKIKEIKLQNSWAKIIGTNVEKQTEFINVSKSTFYVKINSSVVKYELSMMKSQIIKRLNEEAGENLIEKIVFL